MVRRAAVVLLGLSAVALSGCGEAATVSRTDPLAVVTAYMDAVKSGDPNGGQAYLVNLPNVGPAEVLKGSTPVSRYMAAHKGSSYQVVPVPWTPPNSSAAPTPMKLACLIGKGGPLDWQVCLVTVQAGSAFFRFALEDRYEPPNYGIISVDQVRNATDLLPSGNEAHSGI